MLARFLFRAWKARWRDHRAELGALRAAIAPGELAIDAGAHKGSFLYTLARAARPGLAIAFEPQPELASYLERAAHVARLSNVVVERCALSDEEGERELLVPSDGFTQGASLESSIGAERACRSVTVRTMTLDRYLQGQRARVAALKLDVEGHEPALLRGAERTLAEHRPLLVLECEERHLGAGGTARLFAWLRERGYDGDFVQRGRLRPLREFEPTLHQRRGPGAFWNEPDYCNNFVLRHRGRGAGVAGTGAV